MATIMTTLGFDIFARDHGATRTLKGIGDQTDRAAQKAAAMRKIYIASAVAIAAGLIKFGRSSVTAFAEAEEAQKQLGFAFQKFPALANSSQAALQKLNSALQKKTRFDDDAIASGQAMLAQFKLTGKQIEEITPLVLDYASRTGKDIPQAANDVGKALLGNAKALKNVGIFYKSTGDAGQDFANITALLREKVGGFAALEGKSFSGRLAILKNQFGELQEGVGSKIVPALTKLVNVGLGVVAVIDKLGPGTKVFVATMLIGAPAVLLFGAGIFKIKNAALAARTALVALIGTAKGATLAMGGIGIALAALGIIFGAMAAKSAATKQAVGDLREELIASNGAITDSIRLGKQKALIDSGMADKAAALGISLDLLTRAHLGEKDALDQVNGVLDNAIRLDTGYSTSANAAQIQTHLMADGARKLKKDLAAGNITLEEAKRQASLLAGAQKGLGGETKTSAQKIAEANTELKKMTASMWAANTAALALSGSEIATEQAFDDAMGAIKRNGKTLNLNTQAGRDNQTSLNNLVSSNETYIQSLIDSKAPHADIAAAQKEAKKDFLRVADAMDMPIGKAKRLAERYFGIPKDVETKIKQRDMAKMQQLADDLKAKYGFVPKTVETAIKQKDMDKAKKAARDYEKDHLGKIERKVDTKVGQPGIQKARVEARQYQQAELRKIERKVPTQITQPGMASGQREAHFYQRSRLRNIERSIRTLFSQPGMPAAQRNTSTLGSRMRNLPNVSRFLNFTSNARSLASKLGIKLARGGPVVGPGGGLDDQVPAWLSNGEFVVNARSAKKNRRRLQQINDDSFGDHGGLDWGMAPRFAGGGFVNKVASIPSTAMSFPGSLGSAMGNLADRIKNSWVGKVAARMKSLVDKLFTSVSGFFGSVFPTGGWTSIYRVLRAAGARSFTTYAGHDQGASRSRDIWPPRASIAEAARRLSSIWYVIYNRRIASITYGRRWRAYHGSNPHTDHVHVTLRPGVKAKSGGLLGLRGAEFAMLGEGGPERVLDARMTKKFDRAFNVGGGGVGSTTINISLSAPNYVGTPNDLIKTLTDASRRGQLDGVIRQAKRALSGR